MMKAITRIIVIAGGLLLGTETKAVGICPDASSMTASSICFSCLFPLRIAGVASGAGPMPPNVTGESVCSCTDWEIGVTVGSWHPTRLIEIVTTPYCSPSMGGVELASSVGMLQGSVGKGENDNGDLAFFNLHDLPFPYRALIDPFGDTPCAGVNTGGPIYFSELDPTWNNEELANIMTPEIALVSNPIAISSCATDAVAATAGEPLDALFWCAGSWGNIYPFSGLMRSSSGADPTLTSLAATKSRAAIHRRGFGLLTVGDEALCGGVPSPFMQKSQYRMSMVYPIPEVTGNHAIGASTATWGLGHSYPGPGDEHVYLLWEWEDCCLPVL
jgi:conjugal transfer pilus assembly protein TraU